MKRFLLFAFMSLFSYTYSFSQASGNIDLGSQITNGVTTGGCVSACNPTYCSPNGSGNHSTETMTITITGIPAAHSVEITFLSVLCGSTSGLDGGDDIFIDGVKVFDGSGNAEADFTECVAGGADIVVEFLANRRDEILNVSWDSGPTDPGAGCFMPAVPVEFGMVEARTDEDKVNLYWETYSEINNDYFDIQWSRDGQTFETIGNISGAGNSVEKLSYSLRHDNPVNGQNMYRVKQVDFDGSYAYSKVITTRVERNLNDLVLAPSPVKNQLFISNAEINSLVIFSITGKEVARYDQVLNGTVDVSLLSSGLYLVRMETSNGIVARKMIKQ